MSLLAPALQTSRLASDLRFVFENAHEVKSKAKSLMRKNRNKFTHKKMTELLDQILEKYTKDLPSQVQLKLPKLKKVGESGGLPKIKLPKLKKVTTEGASV